MDKLQIDLDAELAKTRRRISRRLVQALREGRLHEELMTMERKGRAFYPGVLHGHRNGSTRNRKRSAR